MANIPTPPDLDLGDGGPVPADDLVTIPRAELEALRARFEAAPEPTDRPRDPGRSAEAKAGVPDRGADPELAGELASRDRRLVELERTCRSAVRDRELATALAGRPLVSGAASQLLKLLRDDLDVYEEDGGYKVAAKDGRTVSQAVNQWLASPEFSHFCLPTSRGGTGARGANRPVADAAPTGPKNLGEAAVMKWREAAASRPDNLLKPIGLRRHR